MLSRRSLARIIELLGKSEYERVLEMPMQLGATHTQVLGTEALNIIAGRNESNRLVRRAARVTGISEMIGEYLLPVVAAMLVGALGKLCRPELEAIMGRGNADFKDPPGNESNLGSFDLPRVSGGVGFSGSTGGAVSVAGNAASASHYVALADEIRRPAAGTADQAQAVRRVLAPILGLSNGPLGWIRRIGSWSTVAFHAALTSMRR